MPLRPLEGFRIGVTADRRSHEQAELLERRGATVVRGPTISTEYLGSDAALRSATEAVIASGPAFLVATTGIGMRAWFEAAQTWGLAADLEDSLRATHVFARGPKAVAAVNSAGLEVCATAPTERLDELLDLLLARDISGQVVVFQHYGEHNQAAVDALVAAGASVLDVPVYRWRLPDDSTEAHRLIDATIAGDIDAVTFTSAPAVANLFELARINGRDAALLAAFNDNKVVAGCIGTVCAGTARAAGIERPVVPAHGRLGLLVRALDNVLRERRTTIADGAARVVVQGRAVAVNDSVIELTPRELAVLDALVRRAGAVTSKATLLREVWGDGADPHAVEAIIGRLRRRLGPGGAILRSVRGRGYLIEPLDGV